MTTLRQPPIFILGMLQRTGTNHLWDLFGLHPDVELLEPVFEDHLVRWSPHLFAYVEDVTTSWDPAWNVPAAEGVGLTRAVGDGVARWISGHSDRRVVTKMPSVEQATRFFELFDGCPLVVIIRNGRNVAESMSSTFDMSYERAFRRWRLAADVVLQLQRDHGARDDFAVVKYEDIVDHPDDVMRRLCTVAGLDPDTYPYADVPALPVRGSSELRSASGTEVHWSAVERRDDFDPHSRWHSWDDHLHRRFNAVAGPQQVALGYDIVDVAGTESINQHLRTVRDVAYTRYLELRVKAGRAQRSVRRVHGRI